MSIDMGICKMRLVKLREEVEADGLTLDQVEAPMALVLSDVCNALGFSPADHDEVLGKSAEFVRDWGQTQVALGKEQQAAVPVQRLAACATG